LLCSGDSLPIGSNINIPNYNYVWHPSKGLADSTAFLTTFTGISATDITFQKVLKAINP
jgi:hypothetical protein